MAWNTIPTFTVAQKLPAAYMNYVGGDLNTFGAWASYTPTWASSGTAVSIGNGTVTGASMLAGKTCLFRAAVNFGTTTTFGTGTYTLTLPQTPTAGQRFAFDAWIFQGSALYKIHGHATGSTVQLYYISTAGSAVTGIGPTAPVTLTAAAGNGIWVNGAFEVA